MEYMENDEALCGQELAWAEEALTVIILDASQLLPLLMHLWCSNYKNI
jgi:hypothetical protein